MITLYPGQLLILTVNMLAILFFALLFIFRQNYEFLIYIGVIIFFFMVILLTNQRLRYPNSLLWGLSLWSVMHMAGGGIPVGDGVLYGVTLISLVGAPYHVFKYDQLVHMIGFGVATLAMYHVLRPICHTIG